MPGQHLAHEVWQPNPDMQLEQEQTERTEAVRALAWGSGKTVRRSLFGDFTARCEMADSAFACLRFLFFLL